MLSWGPSTQTALTKIPNNFTYIHVSTFDQVHVMETFTRDHIPYCKYILQSCWFTSDRIYLFAHLAGRKLENLINCSTRSRSTINMLCAA